MNTTPNYKMDFGKAETAQSEQTSVVTKEMLYASVLDLTVLISSIL
ncbi:MAG: hypothetical protein K6A73_03815 [Bacteroidales bacterium]|nr:hypothetical protein [Bacteroidales bacterium]